MDEQEEVGASNNCPMTRDDHLRANALGVASDFLNSHNNTPAEVVAAAREFYDWLNGKGAVMEVEAMHLEQLDQIMQRAFAAVRRDDSVDAVEFDWGPMRVQVR